MILQSTTSYYLYYSRHASYYISEPMKILHTKLFDVLPFLQHFILCCNEEYISDLMNYIKPKNDGNEENLILTYGNPKKKMITFRNSLLIMNHFKMI